MKKNVLLCTWLFLSALAGMACTDKQNRAVPVEVTMTKAKLFDKIKGGWAGQRLHVWWSYRVQISGDNDTRLYSYQLAGWVY